MSGVKGDPCGNRKARAPRPAYRGAKTAPRAVFRAGEIPARFLIEYLLRAAYMRPLQVNRKRDIASGCGPGVPGPYGAAMGKRDIIISLRLWEGAAAAN